MTSDVLKASIGALHGRAVLDRRTRVLASKIQSVLPPGAHVLDVGTGDGQIAHLCQVARPDISLEGIDVLVRDTTSFPVRAFDGKTIPHEDKSVDIAMFVDVLHHADDAQALLKEACRVARRGVLIKDHLSENVVDHWTLRLMDWVGNAPHGVALPYNYFSRAAWTAHFREANSNPVSFDKDVPLYPFPLSLIFGRGLHFVALLQPAA